MLRSRVARRRAGFVALGVYGAGVFASIVATAFSGCAPKSPAPSPPAVAAAAHGLRAQDCRACHEDIYRAWSNSHHALANRSVTAALDRAAFDPPAEIALGNAHDSLAWADHGAVIRERYGDAPAREYRPDMVLGVAPLRQYIVPLARGFWQTFEQAYDPAKKEWFNVFGAENRQPGEWGHWTGRGMNWNSRCAHCHMTGLRKNYDIATDTYATTWSEQGVSCVQCHGAMAGHAATPRARSDSPHHDARTMMETCAACHSRNELLIGNLTPGERFADHHRLVLPVAPGVYYPDGQTQDEDFEYGSFVRSKMHHAGVTCLDCHDPHTGQTRLPAATNALCLQCHASGGRPGLQPTAPIIDPVAHSHHATGSPGNLCVECHMPHTNYMQRHARRDHGFLSPDPLLTKELGIPNACNRCHTDRSTDWAIAAADRWYGAKLDRRQRDRARAVAAAQQGDANAAAPLLALLADEPIPSWRATLLLLAGNVAPHAPAVLAAAHTALTDDDPDVRSAAVQVSSADDTARRMLQPQLHDPVRLVRLDAEEALSPELAPDSPERRELDAYLALSLDQPAGQARVGQDLLRRGLKADGLAHLQRAVEWDAFSPALRRTLALALADAGDNAAAAAQFDRAAALAPADATLAFQAGLAHAAASEWTATEASFREAVRRDPKFDRAWYNLGLLLAQTNRLPAASQALVTATELVPASAEYHYALATVLWQLHDREAARAEAETTLTLQPGHSAAAALLRALGASR
ncbi:hypothetical protein K0B96_14770 [Horticoccus luteus]|uniref:Uncharacterized protein n=1 Tax=Horticoccus luteus TaxID=2862869 RepID=A0A8F9TV42_9BACT|nr:multiheme c-type cytochrome [Horticoccus luteus]QYM78546.1 hypothetical protein K0B96_14770 [Horticoccus luteus]